MALITTPSDPKADSYVTVVEADAYFADRSNVENWSTLTDAKKEAALKLATAHIDSLRFNGSRLFPTAGNFRAKQVLEFPRNTIEQRTGSVGSATSTTITDTSLANQTTLPDDFCNDGAIVIISGVGKGQTRKISDFVGSTGVVTVDTVWTTDPDNTSRYLLMVAISDKVKNATCEQALYVLNGGGERTRMQAEGVKSYKIGDLSETFGDGAGGLSTGSVPISQEAKGFLRGLWTICGKIKA